MRIPTKAAMYELYHRGRFGNQLLAWPTVEEYLNSGYEGEVVLRYAGNHGGKWCVYGLAKEQVLPTVLAWQREGADPKLVQVNESATGHALVIQGEVMECPNGLALRYSFSAKPMRQALREAEQNATGLLAWEILKLYLDPPSLDDLRELLRDFDGAAIEFSVWSGSVGNAKRNTVFWEVRHY